MACLCVVSTYHVGDDGDDMIVCSCFSLILSMTAMMMMVMTMMMMMITCLNAVFNYLVGNDGDEGEDGCKTMVARVNVAERTVP